MIQKERIQNLNQKPIKEGKYVLYWMQASQRTEYNHALEYAIFKANELNKPLIVFFGITENFPDANERHYYFMFEGLKELKTSLIEKGINFVIQNISPEKGAIALASDASVVVVDCGYLKIQRTWRKEVAEKIDCSLIQVETDMVIPVETVSSKEEFAARTIRPKIHKQLDRFLVPVEENQVQIKSTDMNFHSLDLENVDNVINKLNIDRSVKKVGTFEGGMTNAKKIFKEFLNQKLPFYAEQRNDPSKDFLSNMSPYLHFGQISPLYIALEILNNRGDGSEIYLEELIVRRELGMNFAYYNENYDNYIGLPEWAVKTLKDHKNDPREYLYEIEDWENGNTHDPYWNAAQLEMVYTGKMHGYMRMYWGKKIIEWSRSPEEAFKTALYLNNKYELDGRDPNGFTGVAWCFGKHDRPWTERPIFGKVRYMNANGLKRKFNIEEYVNKVNKIL